MESSVQALFWDGQHLRLDMAYPTPPADATTAVVRVCLAGVCATALQALAHGQVTVAPLIDRVYPLAEGLQALAHAARPGTCKIVLRMF